MPSRGRTLTRTPSPPSNRHGRDRSRGPGLSSCDCRNFWPRARSARGQSHDAHALDRAHFKKARHFPLKAGGEGRVVASAREPARRTARRSRISAVGVTRYWLTADRRPHPSPARRRSWRAYRSSLTSRLRTRTPRVFGRARADGAPRCEFMRRRLPGRAFAFR